MSFNKVFVVFGATGMQGGSVARALSSLYKVKAVTRNPTSDKAKELSKIGIEVVNGDMDEPETYKSVLNGAYGSFIVTNFWEHQDADRETKQGISAIDACVNAGLKHVIYSGLESCKKLFGIEVPHFEGKSKVVKFAKDSGYFERCTIVKVSAYYEILLSVLSPQRIADDTYVLCHPMGSAKLNMMCVDDLGKGMLKLFQCPRDYRGKSLGLAGDRLTVAEMAAVLTKHLAPKKFGDGMMTCEKFEKLGFPGAEDLANMFRVYQLEKLNRDIELTRSLNPDLLTFEDWVVKHKAEILQTLS